jgi:hypothetical protein
VIRSGGATSNQGRPTLSSSRSQGPKRSESMRVPSPRALPAKTALSRPAIRRLSRQRWRLRTHPNRWSLFLRARPLHAVARSWRKSLNSSSGIMVRPLRS